MKEQKELEKLRAQDQREIKALKKELQRKEKAMAEMAAGIQAVMHDITVLLAMVKRQPKPNPF
ncbi:MAG: hypothetical protein FJ076_13940 [Cyanobacteria bacterium K_DeepCast_35m_m1_288]|nr:hypothetical protein [Cyanobacteria bacterium K_DeepCast_35m_m1_288]